MIQTWGHFLNTATKRLTLLEWFGWCSVTTYYILPCHKAERSHISIICVNLLLFLNTLKSSDLTTSSKSPSKLHFPFTLSFYHSLLSSSPPTAGTDFTVTPTVSPSAVSAAMRQLLLATRENKSTPRWFLTWWQSCKSVNAHIVIPV